MVLYNSAFEILMRITMARENIKLKSEESSQYYFTTKNKKTKPERLVIKKFDKTLRKHVTFKETK